MLRLRLKTADQKFSAKEEELAAALREKAGLAAQLQTVRANNSKIRSRLDAIDATERMVGSSPNTGSVAAVDQKVAAVKEAGITEVWTIAKRDIDVAKMSWNGNTIADTVIALTQSIRGFLP